MHVDISISVEAGGKARVNLLSHSGIFIAVGGNLASRFGPPLATCRAAVAALAGEGITVVARSRWYRSPPDPPSDQPWYVNAVVGVDTDLAPEPLLARLHAVEARFGRVRASVNAARTVDLDLIDHHGHVSEAGAVVVLPHPRLQLRAFVLLPLAEIAPDWRHPGSGVSVSRLIADLTPDQVAQPFAPAVAADGEAPLVSTPP